jgi:hypothetical protein
LYTADDPVISSHLRQCLAIVEDATRGGGAECATRRNPDQWSVVEVVEHLQRAYLGTAKGFERCLEKDTPIATRQTVKQRFYSFALIRLGIFPEGRQAPKHIIPTGDVDLGAVLDATRRDLERLDAAAIKTRARFGGVKVVDHPVLGAFTVSEWLKFHLVHTRHHEKQIRARR